MSCKKFKCKCCKKVCIENLTPWTMDDYDQSTESLKPEVMPTRKAFIYDSPLALNLDGIFSNPDQQYGYPPPYKLRVYTLDYTKANPGVPGPFPYEYPYSLWGGDEKYMAGQFNYPSLLADFGHTHILSIYSKINVKRRCFKAETISQDETLLFLLNGSTQIFKWFANLVDTRGNPIPYDPSKPAGALKQLMELLITSLVPIQPQQIIGAFQYFKNTFAPNNVELQHQIDELTRLIDEIYVRYNIDILSWHETMAMHQDHVYQAYVEYRSLYKLCKNSTAFREKENKVNDFIKTMYDGANQMSGFFCIFYSAVVFLDTFTYDLGAVSEPVIPVQYRQERLTYINSNFQRYWNEHVGLFDDYDKCSALTMCADLENQLFRISISHLESCSVLANLLGVLFNNFDTLVRRNHLFEVLPSEFPSA
jgi:hypothetical protein